jgi:hypothetical protein
VKKKKNDKEESDKDVVKGVLVMEVARASGEGKHLHAIVGSGTGSGSRSRDRMVKSSMHLGHKREKRLAGGKKCAKKVMAVKKKVRQ